jgi:hypothetical protein
MHFAIFIPAIVGANPQHLVPVGLGELLRTGDPGPQMAEIPDRGPNGGPGLLFTWGVNAAFRPGELKWQPAKADKAAGLNAGRFWWGYDPKNPPTPEDLKRKVQLSGELLTLNGQQWLFPNCMKLPHDFILDADGDEVREVQPAYRSIYDRAMWAFNVVKQQVMTREPVPEADCRKYCAEMLALNYRVFRDLIAELRLFNDDNWFAVLARTVDFYSLIEIEAEVKKKREQDFEAALAIPHSSVPGDGPKDSPP